MRLGIMQPYFFPYIGYWQLLSAVDKYVIYDDVNFIKGGWINRNRILNGERIQYFNVQLKGASSFKHINQIEVEKNSIIQEKRKKTIWNAYHKSPYFMDVYPIIMEIINSEETNLAQYLEYSIEKICLYLNIHTELLISSRLNIDNILKVEDRVIDICKRTNANIYYNAIGGKDLYDYKKFKEHGIKLFFLQTKEIVYSQGRKDFVPNLSIIDVLMNNSVSTIQEMLKRYELIGEEYGNRRIL